MGYYLHSPGYQPGLFFCHFFTTFSFPAGYFCITDETQQPFHIILNGSFVFLRESSGYKAG
jgi:hypothetical protein